MRVYFTLAISFMASWVAMLYLSNQTTGYTLLFNRIVYIAPALGLFFFGLFIDASYFKPQRRLKKLNILSALVAFLAIVAAATRLNVEAVKPRFQGGHISAYSIVPGRLNGLVVVALLVLSLLVIGQIISAYKRVDSKTKKSLQYILGALVLTIAVSFFTNALAPLFFGGSDVGDAVSNVTIVLFVTSMAYSALRHSFLDIRLIVARLLGYTAAVLLIATAYGFLVLGLLRGLFGIHLAVGYQVVLAASTAIAALLFQRLKQFFDKVTSRLFYQDAYDAQDLFNNLNQSLVASLEVKGLLEGALNIIDSYLKAEFTVVALQHPDTHKPMIIGVNSEKIAHLKAIHPRQMLQKEYAPVIVADRLPDDDIALKRELLNSNIAILARLGDNKGGHHEVGHLILGPKKSGNPYNSQDLRVLEAIANELVIAIQNALRFEEIEQFNLTLQGKIEDATAKLRRTNERLKILDQTKDDFISMASHQLRTPLTSVKGYVSMVLDGDAGKLSSLQRKLLNQSFVSAQRMVYLISDLLNVSRLRTGKFVIEPVPTNLATIIHDEVEQLVETAKGRNLALSYHKPEHFPTLMLDETKIRQVIMNFIDNAIYYTPAGGHITINLVDKPQSIELTVVDDGIGVPRHEQHHLFTKFFRANNAKRARPDGTGLGLFMAKKVVVEQGGAIIFRSQEGKGSTFGFTLAKDKLPELPVK